MPRIFTSYIRIQFPSEENEKSRFHSVTLANLQVMMCGQLLSPVVAVLAILAASAMGIDTEHAAMDVEDAKVIARINIAFTQ